MDNFLLSDEDEYVISLVKDFAEMILKRKKLEIQQKIDIETAINAMNFFTELEDNNCIEFGLIKKNDKDSYHWVVQVYPGVINLQATGCLWSNGYDTVTFFLYDIEEKGRSFCQGEITSFTSILDEPDWNEYFIYTKNDS